MDYFRLEQEGSVPVQIIEERREPDSVICVVDGMDVFKDVDYISGKGVVSGRLKELLAAFLTKRTWKPYVFVDLKRQEQTEYWQLELEELCPETVWLDEKGKVAGMQLGEERVPRIFRVLSEKGGAVFVLHLTITEALLRRGILGLSLSPITVQRYGKK